MVQKETKKTLVRGKNRMKRDVEGFQHRDFTIEKGLRGFFKNKKTEREVLPIIRKAVRAVAEHLTLYSRHLHQKCLAMRGDDTFFETLGKRSGIRDDVTAFYNNDTLAIKATAKPPSLTGLATLRNTSALQYETCVRENISLNIQRRLQLWYRYLCPGQRLSKANAKKHVLDLVMGKASDDCWNIGPVKLPELLKKNPLRLIPAMIRINDAIIREHSRLRGLDQKIPRFLRTFPIVPMKSFGSHCVQYDSTSIHLLRNQQIAEINRKRKARHEVPLPEVCAQRRSQKFTEPEDVFRAMFKIDDYTKIDSQNRERQFFGGSFKTDGSSISILIRKRIDPESISDEKVTARAGLDPGLDKMAVVVVRDERDKTKMKTFAYKSKTFHKDAGYDVIKKKRDKLTGRVETWNRIQRELLEVKSTPENLHAELMDLEVRQFRSKCDVYMTPAMCRLRRRKKIRTRQALDRFASKLAPKTGKLHLYYGSGFGTGFGMRGHRTPPHVSLRMALERHPRIDVTIADEYNSTKLCCRCHQRLDVSRTPHRYVYCRKCRKHMNRDTNAAQNILQNGLRPHLIQKGRRPIPQPQLVPQPATEVLQAPPQRSATPKKRRRSTSAGEESGKRAKTAESPQPGPSNAPRQPEPATKRRITDAIDVPPDEQQRAPTPPPTKKSKGPASTTRKPFGNKTNLPSTPPRSSYSPATPSFWSSPSAKLFKAPKKTFFRRR